MTRVQPPLAFQLAPLDNFGLNCTTHGRVRHHQLTKMADALFEFVGSFSLVCAFVRMVCTTSMDPRCCCKAWVYWLGSQAAVEMSEGCFRRLRSLPRGTCLFLQNGGTKGNSKPDTAQSMFYVKISHVCTVLLANWLCWEMETG